MGPQISYQTSEGHTSTANLDTDPKIHTGLLVHNGEDWYTDEPVSVMWDETYGKWLQVSPAQIQEMIRHD